MTADYPDSLLLPVDKSRRHLNYFVPYCAHPLHVQFLTRGVTIESK